MQIGFSEERKSVKGGSLSMDGCGEDGFRGNEQDGQRLR
jgi:hypothetical protein